ncbi:DNA binding domain-containing protein, excisionase family [Abditibacterium utsteinense]|uniref:DNA binding domain-containing protein, excisionase family n=1 Tax=Abditibacterium utsteinense TaxID=1960156 RepID=A0A2S8SNQ1_9BACT|nr:DNA binding domain-containing protein, excisionase family [Abditibacterium utsteinense]
MPLNQIPFFTYDEAAQQLSVTRRTITKAVGLGMLTGVKVGSSVAVIADNKFRNYKPGPSRWAQHQTTRPQAPKNGPMRRTRK